MMPELNGEQMCRIVKNDVETSHIPVILLTALNDKESIIKGLQSKADRYIIKPFDVGVLKANITNVLAIRGAYTQTLQSIPVHHGRGKCASPTIGLRSGIYYKSNRNH